MSELAFYKELYPVSISKAVATLAQSLVDKSILDNEEMQEVVEDYIFNFFYHTLDAELTYPDNIGNYVNCMGAGFRILPNIPIIQAFLKKWNTKPLFEGKKWIVTLEETKYYCFHEDAESYLYEFGSGSQQSYEFYVKSCPATEIKEEDYEYEPFEKRYARHEKEEEEQKNYLENCTNEELLAEIMRRYTDERSIDTDEVAEGLSLMFKSDGTLNDKRVYDFNAPYHTPFLDYGGDEFHIDPVLRKHPEVQAAFIKRKDDDI